MKKYTGKMKKNNKWIITLVAIFLLFSVIAISFGYFLANVTINGSIYDVTGTADSTTADITLTNLTSNVSITNGYPMTEAEAEENIDPYTFTITNNSTTRGAAVQIVLETKSGTNTIPDRLIDAKIRSNSGALTNTNVFTNTTASQTGYQSAYVLWSGVINPGSRTFNLLLWIDENGDSNGGANDVQNKAWYGKIVVKATDTEVVPYLTDTIIAKYGTDANLYYHTTDTTKYSNGEDEISSTNASSETDTYANLNAGDNSYRYSGANPNNYICFGTDDETTCKNNTDNNGTSKYLYRIIGVFDDGNGNYVTKIVLANPLYNSTTSAATYRWDYNGSTYTNEWSNASLKQWLNGETLKSGSESYYPATKFLSNYSSAWINKIAPSTWYVRGFTDRTKNTKGIYTDEIANVKNGVNGYTTNYQENSATLTNTKVGLEYISDYMYAASPTYWNYPGYSSSGATYDYRATTTANWLSTGVHAWSISPNASGKGSAWLVNASGLFNGNIISNTRAVFPVVYLASDIEIDTTATSADGSSSHPYILKVS